MIAAAAGGKEENHMEIRRESSRGFLIANIGRGYKSTLFTKSFFFFFAKELIS